MRLLAVWVINAPVLLLVAYPFKGIHMNGFGSALIAALMLGLANTLIYLILVVLILPVTLFTLGLLTFITNTLLFLLVGNLLVGFQVASFGVASLGSILYSVISWLLSNLLLREA